MFRTVAARRDVTVASGCASLVPMMKAANFRERHDATFRWRLDATWRGCVLLKGEMSSCPMIVGNIPSDHVPQMRRAEDDDVIQTLPT
jgi:hypothetical protein